MQNYKVKLELTLVCEDLLSKSQLVHTLMNLILTDIRVEKVKEVI